MGILISKQLQENFKKQQQFQLESQRLQMERQLQMQQLIQERMMAMQVARARDISYYILFLTGGVGAFGSLASLKKKNPAYIAPLFPLLFISHYFYDLGYGNKLTRIRNYAEDILASKPELIGLPNGPVTFDEVEQRRLKLKDEERLKPNELYL